MIDMILKRKELERKSRRNSCILNIRYRGGNIMNNPAGKLFQRNSIRIFLIALLFFISLFFILLINLKPEKFDLTVGQRAPEDIQAPKI